MNLIGEKAIKALRKGNFKLHITHMRYVKEYGLVSMTFVRQNGLQHLLRPTGGKTIAHLIDLDQGVMKQGIVQCSKSDHYDRKVGLSKAFYLARESDVIYAADINLLSPLEKEQFGSQVYENATRLPHAPSA